LVLPETSWRECQQQIRLQDLAARHHWLEAERQLRFRLHQAVTECRRQLHELCSQLETSDAPKRPATLGDLVADLLALEREFGNRQIDLRCSVLSVETEPIVLEGVDLGRFRIALDWSRWGSDQPYDVIALKPYPAACNSDTTHPHVERDGLCTGDGRVPIQQALAEGRLFDLFLLIRQILSTYNPDSAYVKLEDWNGIDCHDCGRRADDDERDSCDRCGDDLCLDCTVSCERCDRRCCTDCSGQCAKCHDPLCDRCCSCCTVCDETYCQECLTDEICSECREQQEDEVQETTDRPTCEAGQSSDTAVHADGVGETPVPA